ncbi:type II toxin-antitoxin system PemK/MazF family toxin [Pandoraea pneumonica]|uniref:type II toxin-antitoxin system PemK/MazF family toxin n=1 Tax=Pandoraea pneumonica TaxID=2508299 RepID=UPI0012405B3A|nr:type II toxin-antitoxin system PemK/MazF family toxin [Pandoraea pneumonica]
MVKRGDVWFVVLDPTVGSEIRKTRPCVVVSPARMHQRVRTVIVAPLTSSARLTGYRVPTCFDGRRGSVVIDQVRAIDRRRLVRRVGVLNPSALSDTMDCLREAFADDDRNESMH